MAELTLSGMDDLLANLQKLDDRLQNQVTGRALKAGGKVLAHAISQRAPRSASPRQPKEGTQSWRTGQHAADHIIISRVKKGEDGRYVEVGPVPSDNSPYFYAKNLALMLATA